MSKINILPTRRNVIVPAVIAMLLCAIAGCTPAQQQSFSTFAQDFLRNLLAALAL